MICAIRTKAPFLMSVGMLVASCGIALDGAAQVTTVNPEDMAGVLFRWTLGS